ncbi:hypothetical protein ABZX12_26385 [Kribbella sp. NPDC003505]|uniref:hypothetical protein n=1 Tax=Kribbella sp. NPDC003505 TaxID=3154448 RepID=UPI0033AF706F
MTLLKFNIGINWPEHGPCLIQAARAAAKPEDLREFLQPPTDITVPSTGLVDHPEQRLGHPVHHGMTHRRTGPGRPRCYRPPRNRTFRRTDDFDSCISNLQSGSSSKRATIVGGPEAFRHSRFPKPRLIVSTMS